MENLDTRVRYTKAALQQSLLKILINKPIDKVTIKELCDGAKLNRGTFYLHYTTPNDVLMEIEQQFIDENLSHVSPYLQNSRKTSRFNDMFTCILKNRDVCRILMGHNGNPKFVERMSQLMRDGVINEWCREFPQYRRENLDYIYDFIFSGATQLILNWIEDDKGVSTEQLARRLDRLGHYCQLATQEF